MPGYDEKEYLKILHDNWGYADFRGIQRDIIRSIAEGYLPVNELFIAAAVVTALALIPMSRAAKIYKERNK